MAEEHLTVKFEEDVRPAFTAMTGSDERETIEEFRRLERHRDGARGFSYSLPDQAGTLLLAGIIALTATDGWLNVYWGDQESFGWEEEPEFLRQVLEVIVDELAAVLPSDVLPEGLTIHVELGGRGRRPWSTVGLTSGRTVTRPDHKATHPRARREPSCARVGTRGGRVCARRV